jgi:hypothetical protein
MASKGAADLSRAVTAGEVKRRSTVERHVLELVNIAPPITTRWRPMNGRTRAIVAP